MPRLPAIGDRAAWEKMTTGRGGIRWDNVVEKMWKDLGGDQEEALLSTEKAEVKERVEERERLVLRSKVKKEKHLRDRRGVEGRYWNGTYLHGPTDYAKKLKLRFRVGDLDLPERRKIYTKSREEEDVATNMCPCGTTIESRTHIVGECELY